MVLSWNYPVLNAGCDVFTGVTNGYCNIITTALPNGGSNIDLKCESDSNFTLSQRCELPQETIEPEG